MIGHHENVVEFLTPDLEWQEYITFKPPGIFDYDNKNSERLSAIYRYFEDIWQEVRRSGPKALIPIPVVAYYRAKRWFNPHQDLVVRAFEVIERHEVFRNALIAGENYDAMLLWYYIKENQELRDRLQNGQDSSFRLPELKAVRSAISKVIGDVNNISFDGNPPKLKVTINDQRALDFEQLSDGYQNLLALVMDFARRLAQANPGWDNPLEAPGILLIDEIELHLHPRWQQEVIPKLREAFPNTQLIVTTHSPQVLTTIHRKNVFILKDQKLYSPDIETYGTESKQSLEDVLETESRPPNNENATEIIELFRLLSKGELTEASLKLNRLVPEPVHVFNTAL